MANETKVSDEQHAAKILEITMDLMKAIDEATQAGLTVEIEPIRIAKGVMSFRADIKRITPIAKFP